MTLKKWCEIVPRRDSICWFSLATRPSQFCIVNYHQIILTFGNATMHGADNMQEKKKRRRHHDRQNDASQHAPENLLAYAQSRTGFFFRHLNGLSRMAINQEPNNQGRR